MASGATLHYNEKDNAETQSSAEARREEMSNPLDGNVRTESENLKDSDAAEKN